MEVTVASGVIEVKLPNGDIQVYNADGIAGMFTLSKPKLVYGANTDTQVTTTFNWYVRVRIKGDNMFLDIPMGGVTNQGTWVNTQPGALIALAALDGVFA